MTTNFDKIIDRAGTSNVKYDVRKAVFGTEDVLPLWVADMDFAAPEAVTEALISRATHPIYGYTLHPESLFTAMQDWFKQRHDWTIARKSILICPGVVPSMHAVIEALSDSGDSIIIQPPIYPPFFSAITETGRKVIENPLKLVGGDYKIDLEHLEQCAIAGAKMLLLCSPHNPVGRVWQKQELEAVLDIARRYDLIILSDEIHADLIYPDYQHIPLATLANDVSIITLVSPSKTFNIPGLGLSSLVVDNRQHWNAIKQVFDRLHISASNPFSITAFEAAYRAGEIWLDELMVYLDETRRDVTEMFERHVPNIKVVLSQGTYLLWLDCRAMKLTDDELSDFFIKEAKVGMNPGISFGNVGSGFMRMNIAAPRPVVMAACQAIVEAMNNAI
ncbi:MAG: PatB family C-S lyase [Gammaproteobacteria bacterium]|nr:PatB family C-S lyase [Gammaproteobacteria bacterium]